MKQNGFYNNSELKFIQDDRRLMMRSNTDSIGTVISDEETPSFESVRIKLKTGQDVKPGTLIRVSVSRGNINSKLIARVRSAYEHNPNEGPEDINVRDKMGIPSNYPPEEDSTIIYRLAEAELIEEIIGETMQTPQTLPQSGADVFIADNDEIVKTLGLVDDEEDGLKIGETVAGTTTKIILKREAIQRHLFLCGTTGSGKSYAMGVIAEELVRHNLPIIFIDTQDEYSVLVGKLGGMVVEPGEDFTIRISSLTESELIDLLPAAMKGSDLQCDIVGKAFGELYTQRFNGTIAEFTLDDVINGIPDAAKALCARSSDAPRATDTVQRRLETLRYHKIFGKGIDVEDWGKSMYPCLAINCKHLTTPQLQSVATAILRELQTLRFHKKIPPYVAVIDEAHLFVPEGEGSSCKQIIREGVRIGRHHGIAMVLMTQSPVDIDKRAIRQCNTRLVFALEPDQLDAIRGVRSDASEEMLRALPKMPQGTCLLSGTYESVKHTIPVKIRERETPCSEGGETPDIFEEMQEDWIPKLKEGETNGT
jgi:DNA helicase HerA-like ATPase